MVRWVGAGTLRLLGSFANQPVVGRGVRPPQEIEGRRILVTGASSGVGRATATRLAGNGAHIIAVARREPELEELCAELGPLAGTAVHRRCDLADREDVDELVRWVSATYGGVDILVNNAARSIRRPIVESLDRLHDFDRVMAVNYHGPVRLTLGLLPAMIARGSGQVINVGTWTVPAGTSPRFAAYHSSKLALHGFGRCVDAELARRGVRVTAVHYPLVHTGMSLSNYGHLPGLSPDEAARWIEVAIRRRPARIVPRFAGVLGAVGVVAPRLVDSILWRWG